MRSIHVLRKPCSESTVAANVLRHGTGAINVDACRVPSNGEHMVLGVVRRVSAPAGDERRGASRGWWRPGQTFVPTNHLGGRWPANLVLQHLDGCVQDGTKKVNDMGATGSRYAGTEGPANINTGGAPLARRAWVSDDGTETVAAWVCAPGCPVAVLDAQSGTAKSAMRKPTGKPMFATEGTAMVWNSNSVTDTTERGFTDEGGASRFFKQVKP